MLIELKDPKGLVDILTSKHKFKLKGTGTISYYLGCDFVRDDNRTLNLSPRKDIEKLLTTTSIFLGQSLNLTSCHH